ncbi:hypothetical protein [Herbaspirillum huttiense]|uniref:hypothetical protein n=1 Tax=Herbaspirillum huttiense TaxID=863372 RepID=UPI003B3B42BC
MSAEALKTCFIAYFSDTIITEKKMPIYDFIIGTHILEGEWLGEESEPRNKLKLRAIVAAKSGILHLKIFPHATFDF